MSRVGGRDETLISPKLQERAIASWAKTAGAELVMLPAELDASGGDDSRPILNRAIEQIEGGEFDGIAVWKFDRFTRSLVSSLRFLERIEAVGGHLRSASEPLDASTPEGRMVRNFLLSIAQGEREQKAAEFERAKADAVARGIHISGRTPLGYKRGPDRCLVPNENASLVRELFEGRAQGRSWRELADHAAERLGRPMYGPTIARLIANPVYGGEARQGEHVNPTAHEPLVDAATREAAQRRRLPPARGVHGQALLGGIVRCSGCSWRMTSTIKRGEREYRCRRRGAMGACPEPAIIQAKLIEPYVESVFLEHASSISVSASERSRAIADIEGRLAEAEAELAAYQEATKVAGVGAQHFADGMRSRVRAVEAARRDLAQARLASPPVPAPGDLAGVWPSLTVGERNHVLRGSLGVVWVRKGRGLGGRVRIVERGAEPAGLSVQGKPSAPRSIDWVDLPGEVRSASAQDFGEGASGA